METILFALVASHAYRQQELVVAEPQEFQPFDLRGLRSMNQLPLYRGASHNAQRTSLENAVAFTKEWSLSKSS
jgi:hypothetical protein